MNFKGQYRTYVIRKMKRMCREISPKLGLTIKTKKYKSMTIWIVIKNSEYCTVDLNEQFFDGIFF